jgi:hypothetical protein
MQKFRLTRLLWEFARYKFAINCKFIRFLGKAPQTPMILEIAMKRQQSAYTKKMIEKAWAETIKQIIPEGGIITPEATNEFVNRIAQDFIKFNYRMLRKKL